MKAIKFERRTILKGNHETHLVSRSWTCPSSCSLRRRRCRPFWSQTRSLVCRVPDNRKADFFLFSAGTKNRWINWWKEYHLFLRFASNTISNQKLKISIVRRLKFWEKDEDRIFECNISLKFMLISSTIMESVFKKLDISLLLTEHSLLGRRPAMASLFNFFYDQLISIAKQVLICSGKIMTLPTATPVI